MKNRERRTDGRGRGERGKDPISQAISRSESIALPTSPEDERRTCASERTKTTISLGTSGGIKEEERKEGRENANVPSPKPPSQRLETHSSASPNSPSSSPQTAHRSPSRPPHPLRLRGRTRRDRATRREKRKEGGEGDRGAEGRGRSGVWRCRMKGSEREGVGLEARRAVAAAAGRGKDPAGLSARSPSARVAQRSWRALRAVSTFLARRRRYRGGEAAWSTRERRWVSKRRLRGRGA